MLLSLRDIKCSAFTIKRSRYPRRVRCFRCTLSHVDGMQIWRVHFSHFPRPCPASILHTARKNTGHGLLKSRQQFLVIAPHFRELLPIHVARTSMISRVKRGRPGGLFGKLVITEDVFCFRVSAGPLISLAALTR